MRDDLPERLRAIREDGPMGAGEIEDIHEAADALEQQAAAIERLTRERDEQQRGWDEARRGMLLMDEAATELEADRDRLRAAFTHTFSPTEFGGDECRHCGLDIRNAVHRRTPAEGDKPIDTDAETYPEGAGWPGGVKRDAGGGA